MHNCKATTNELIEMAVSDAAPGPSPALLAEVRACAACREEFAALQNVRRATAVVRQSAQPAEHFWPGYHQRLRQRLEGNAPTFRQAFNDRANGAAWWRELLTASIRVPVPVALASVFLILFSIFFMLHSRLAAGATPVDTPPAVITRTVEVPVIQERVLTRVVYKSVSRPPRDSMAARRESAPAPDNRNEVPAVAQGLEGFKPANEPRLTIIKGSYRDEK